MFQSIPGKFSVIITCILLTAGISQAANDIGPRTFVPVQKGFNQQADAELPYAPDRILVQFRKASVNASMRAIPMVRGAGAPGGRMNLQSVDALAAAHGVVSAKRPYHSVKNQARALTHGLDRWFLYQFEGAGDLPEVAAAFRADPNVEAVSLDWRAYPMTVPNDPLYPNQWGHHNTGQLPAYSTGTPVGTPGFDSHAEEAWSKSQGYGSSAVTIAIVDTGVDIGHPDLNLVAGYDFGDNDPNPDDDSLDNGHGTACAGIAAGVANNSLGVTGIAGGVRIMPCKVANFLGSMYFSAIQDALYWAADNGADVISISLGAGINSDPATDAALQYADNAGCLILAATGNENASTISYPAIHAAVMGIGAASPCGDRKRSSNNGNYVNPGVNTDPNGTTCDNQYWWGSNYGSNTPDDRGAVDVIAPTIMPTTDITGSGGYASGDYSMGFNGTSCATPYAAGVAALVISSNPGLTNDAVWLALTSSATDIVNVESVAGWDRYSGYGMVNADAAIGGGGGPVAPVPDFSADPTSGYAPLTVTFTDESTGDPTSWLWEFGDGVMSTSTEQNPSYTYNTPGEYTVSLTATNDEGSVIRTKTGYISVLDASAVSYVTAYGETSAIGVLWEGDSYLYTHFDDDDLELITEDVISYRGRQTTALEHYWHFNLPSGDATFKLIGGRAVTSEGENFIFDYTTDGSTYLPLVTVASDVVQTYTVPIGQVSGEVTVRAIDSSRPRSVIDLDSVYIDWMAFEMAGTQPVAPTADFVGSPTSGDVSLTVDFTDLSSGEPTSWSWSFGDGNASTAQSPSHTYTTVGTYSVSLTATNAQGSDTMTKTDYITVTESGTGPSLMIVASMVVTRSNAGPNVFGVCDILVTNESGSPVDGASVSVRYDGPTSGTLAGTTVGGAVTFKTSKLKNPSGTWCFTVVDIVLDPLEYTQDGQTVCE